MTFGICYYCCERERVGYWSYWCEDCALLRRMLLVYDPKKCIEILKRTCLRDGKQIDFKINQEIKKIITNEIEALPKLDDSSHEEPDDDNVKNKHKTRSKTKSL